MRDNTPADVFDSRGTSAPTAQPRRAPRRRDRSAACALSRRAACSLVADHPSRSALSRHLSLAQWQRSYNLMALEFQCVSAPTHIKFSSKRLRQIDQAIAADSFLTVQARLAR